MKKHLALLALLGLLIPVAAYAFTQSFSVNVILTCQVLSPAHCWYVDNSVSSSGSGTSWATAWKNFSNISWGSVNAGDIVYISGGSSGQTYNENLTVGSAGTSDSVRVIVRVGQDSGHNGIVTINGLLIMNNMDYVTIDGGIVGDSNQHIQLTTGNDIQTQGNLTPVIRYVAMDAGTISAEYGFHALFSHLKITNGTGDHVIGFTARNHINLPDEYDAYDDMVLEYSYMSICANVTDDGIGADGVQGGPGTTLRYNTIETVTTGCTTGTNHMDFIQSQKAWISVYGNTFKDSSDSIYDYDCWTGSNPNHIRIFNNVFIKNRGGGLIRFYTSSTPSPCLSFNEIHIIGNTFVDHTCCIAGSGITFGGYQANPTVTNTEIKNNIFYNSDVGSIYTDASSGYTQADWNVDYNNLSGGTPGITLDGTSYTQAHPSTCTPSFVNYILDSISSDLHLSSSDTCVRDAGTAIAAPYNVDKDGISRPQGSAFDIGAYEYH